MNSSELDYIKQWKAYLATYPRDFPLKTLESSLASITVDRLTGRKHNVEMWDEVSQLIVAKIIELKQERGEPT